MRQKLISRGGGTMQTVPYYARDEETTTKYNNKGKNNNAFWMARVVPPVYVPSTQDNLLETVTARIHRYQSLGAYPTMMYTDSDKFTWSDRWKICESVKRRTFVRKCNYSKHLNLQFRLVPYSYRVHVGWCLPLPSFGIIVCRTIASLLMKCSHKRSTRIRNCPLFANETLHEIFSIYWCLVYGGISFHDWLASDSRYYSSNFVLWMTVYKQVSLLSMLVDLSSVCLASICFSKGFFFYFQINSNKCSKLFQSTGYLGTIQSTNFLFWFNHKESHLREIPHPQSFIVEFRLHGVFKKIKTRIFVSKPTPYS